MVYKKFGDTYVVRIARGEEIMESLMSLVEKENIALAEINGLGAADHVVFGLFSVEEKQYHKTELNEEFEITNLHGSVSRMDGKPYLHVHINLGGADGIVHGGHLNEARISATCEIFVRCIDGVVERVKDPVTGLNIYDL